MDLQLTTATVAVAKNTRLGIAVEQIVSGKDSPIPSIDRMLDKREVRTDPFSKTAEPQERFHVLSTIGFP